MVALRKVRKRFVLIIPRCPHLWLTSLSPVLIRLFAPHFVQLKRAIQQSAAQGAPSSPEYYSPSSSASSAPTSKDYLMMRRYSTFIHLPTSSTHIFSSAVAISCTASSMIESSPSFLLYLYFTSDPRYFVYSTALRSWTCGPGP